MINPLSEIIYEEGSDAFIKSVRVKDYGPIKDLKLNLTPLHAFIGPNDSGKLSVIQALIAYSLGQNEKEPKTIVEELSQREMIAKQLMVLYKTDEDAYTKLLASVKRVFPHVDDLCIYPTTLDGNFQIEVIVDDARVEQISCGLLNYLSYSLLAYLAEPRYCVISPEVGMHPTMIKEIMKIFRELSKKAQVFIITYSPLVINEMEDNEVTLITRNKGEGTKATRLCDIKTVEALRSEFDLGELWYNLGEERLLSGNRKENCISHPPLVHKLRADRLREGISIITLLSESGLCKSRNKARRCIYSGGIRIGEQVVKDINQKVIMDDFQLGYLLLYAGKKCRKLLISQLKDTN